MNHPHAYQRIQNPVRIRKENVTGLCKNSRPNISCIKTNISTASITPLLKIYHTPIGNDGL